MTDLAAPGTFSVLALDLGSSSIKVLRADVSDGGAPRLTSLRDVVHRPVQRGACLEWDVVAPVLDLVVQGSRQPLDGRLAVTLDAWGDALVFLDRHGRRIGPLRSYRDPALAGAAADVRRRDLPGLVAERTGCTVGAGSTLVQLRALLDERPAWLSEVASVVPLVDHLGDLLTAGSGAGVEVGLSPASTSGFVDPRTGAVDRGLLEELEIPESWIPEPAAELRTAGTLAADRLTPGASGLLVKVAGHDTATALVGGPASSPGRCFVSLGSWAVVGVVVSPGRRGAAPFRTLAPVMHEATADGGLRVNRNVPGLRLVQQLEHEHLGRPVTQAERASLFPVPEGWDPGPVVDVFALDGHRPLREQLEAWGRRVGRAVGSVEQQLLEVLRGVAWAVAGAVDDLRAAGLTPVGRSVWVCGGGVRAVALTTWLAELTGAPVEHGPAAASAVGGAAGAASVLRPDGPGAAADQEEHR